MEAGKQKDKEWQKEAERMREEMKIRFKTNFADISGPGVRPLYIPVQTPPSEILSLIPNCQSNYRCRDLELNLMDCMDAYGRKGISRQCKDYYEDYKECLFAKKQLARVRLMQKERLRQYLAGERSKANLYSESPLLDGYKKTYKSSIGG